MLHDFYLKIGPGTVSIYHSRLIGKLSLVNSTVWHFVHMALSDLPSSKMIGSHLIGSLIHRLLPAHGKEPGYEAI